MVVDANGNPDPNLRYKSVTCGSFSADATDSLESQTSGQSVLRYEAGANKFTYNWQTPSTKGCYVLYLLLDDGSTHQANFQLK